MSELSELARQMFEARDRKIAQLESDNTILSKRIARLEKLRKAVIGHWPNVPSEVDTELAALASAEQR